MGHDFSDTSPFSSSPTSIFVFQKPCLRLMTCQPRRVQTHPIGSSTRWRAWGLSALLRSPKEMLKISASHGRTLLRHVKTSQKHHKSVPELILVLNEKVPRPLFTRSSSSHPPFARCACGDRIPTAPAAPTAWWKLQSAPPWRSPCVS